MAFLSEIQVTINGDSFRDFTQVNIVQNLYKTGEFTLACRFDALENPDEFLLEQSQKFLGKQIVIKAKAKEYNEDEVKESLVFRGIITGVSGSKTGMADGNRIILSGYSPEILLNRKPNSRAFLDKTLKDVVNEVLKPYDAMLLNPRVDPRNKHKFSYIVQYEESDLEFLRRLSVRYGEWFYYTGDKLVFGELQKESVDMTIGIDTDELNYSLNIEPLKFSLYTWEVLNHKSHEYKYKAETADSELTSYGKSARKVAFDVFHEEGIDYYEHLNLEEASVKDVLEAAGELQAKADALRLTEIRGRSRNSFAKIGYAGSFKAVKETEQGTVDYGENIFTEINHSLDNLLNYRNVFSAIPGTANIPGNSNPYCIRRAYPQLAEVKDNKDPEKLGRIRVRFSWMAKGQMSPWLNITTPYVHKSCGFYFVPSINSAVLISFEGGDIEKPYCHGAFFDKDACPDEKWTGNYNQNDAKIHAIRTKSGNTIEFHDSEGSEKIVIYDKGKQNQVILNSPGNRLSLHSGFETHITAKGMASISLGDKEKPEENEVVVWLQEDFINIESKKGNIEISSDKSVGVRAMQGTIYLQGKKIVLDASESVEIKGPMIKMEGQASAEVKAATVKVDGSAMTEIKGGIVKIN